jgi:hypothetical protein
MNTLGHRLPPAASALIVPRNGLDMVALPPLGVQLLTLPTAASVASVARANITPMG